MKVCFFSLTHFKRKGQTVFPLNVFSVFLAFITWIKIFVKPKIFIECKFLMGYIHTLYT